MTPDVPAIVPIVSDVPSVTATLPAFAARVPILFPLAVRVKVPFEPESSRLEEIAVEAFKVATNIVLASNSLGAVNCGRVTLCSQARAFLT